ncbi:AAA family ATPase [Natroniella sp. ANB-PHB2]|uniref:AAA family ATPase n=1 Tax=Natroniella sp. ANB-PHB2 TaxID=3384444 RepID=UPI0038D40907
MPLINRNLSKREILRQFEEGEISITEVFELLGEKEDLSIEKQDGEDKQLEKIMEQLDRMVGLENIKKLVLELKAFIEIQQERQRRNLKNDPIVMHMVFKGNPGTGKTTVARIFGQLFKELGLLEEGHLKEAERADLVGKYIGHTAKKTREIIEEALGGILFIDEAYALARGGEQDFGKEAIDTLVKEMEDEKDNLIVILAGYPKEMEYFLQSNPGLKSRFPIQVEFEDYSLEELIKIARLMAQQKDYNLSSSAKAKLYQQLAEVRRNVGVEEGNARTVRNLIERAIRKQALRLVDQEKVTKKDLITITREDLV